MELLFATDPLICYALILNGLLAVSLFVWGGVWSVLRRGRRLWLVVLFGVSQLLVNIVALPPLLRGALLPGYLDRVPVDYGVDELSGGPSGQALVHVDRIEVAKDVGMLLELREQDGLLHQVSIPQLGKRRLLLPFHSAGIHIPAESVSEDDEVTLRCSGGLLHGAHEFPVIGVLAEGCASPWVRCCGYFTPEARGGLWVPQMACTGCHSTDGSKLVGPSFKGLWGSERRLSDGSVVVADEDYIRESIRVPGAKIVEGYAPQMPPYDEHTLSDAQIDDIIAYLRTLK